MNILHEARSKTNRIPQKQLTLQGIWT